MAKSKLTEAVIKYVAEKYGVEPEFLWENDFDDGALRHPDTKKWFGIIMMNTRHSVLGLSGEGRVDVINVKCDPLLIERLIDGKGYLPAYHMNKRHWITLLLDGSVDERALFALIDRSYDLTRKKSMRKAPQATPQP